MPVGQQFDAASNFMYQFVRIFSSSRELYWYSGTIMNDLNSKKRVELLVDWKYIQA